MKAKEGCLSCRRNPQGIRYLFLSAEAIGEVVGEAPLGVGETPRLDGSLSAGPLGGPLEGPLGGPRVGSRRGRGA